MEFLRDPAWQSIGSIIGLIALVVTIIIFKAQKQRKKLSYEIIANSALFGKSVKDELSNKTQITYAGKTIQDLRLVVFRIYNSGNTAITSSEFETPVEIIFQDSSEILDANVISTKPSKLQPIIEVQKNKIAIKPLLLNSDDEIIIKTLVDNYSPEINFVARIAGIKEIESSGDSSFISFLPYLLFAIYALGGFAGAQAQIFLLAILSLIGAEIPSVVISLINLIGGFFFTFIALIVAIYTFRKTKQTLS